MNRFVAAPARAISTMLRAAGSSLSYLGRTAAKHLTLVPYYLDSLLWLLSAGFLDLARQGYAGNSAVYAVLRVLSTSVSEPPLLAYTMTPAGEPDKPLPWGDPLMRLIRQPNELMSEPDMWELVTLHLAISGRTTWWKERDRSGHIIALWPLRPDRVGPIYSNSSDAGQHVIHGWSYLIPGTSDYQPIGRDDIFFVNLPDPAGDSGGIVEGLGPLQALAAEAGADNEATRFVGALVANYGAPGVVLTTKDPLPDQETATRIKTAFMREFGGARRGLPGVLDADTTVTEVGFNLQQLEFPALRSHSESRIAAALGVPAILVGLQVGLNAGIRATIAEQREYFTETTLSNYWRRYEAAYTNQIAAEFGPGIICHYDLSKVKALTEQLRSEATKIERAYELGAVTVNEYRQAVLNYEPRLDGDVRVLSKGAVEIDENGEIVGAPTPPEPATMTQPQNKNGSKPAPNDAKTTRSAEGRIVVNGRPSEAALERHKKALDAWHAKHGAHV